jgi:glucokinase
MDDDAPRGLIGDIGATNSRLALVEPDGSFAQIRVFPTEEFAGLGDIIEAYFASKARAHKPPRAVLAVASPITGDRVSFTNAPWSFSIEEMRRRFGFERLHVINDFAANAFAIPYLQADDLMQIGTGEAAEGATIGVIGPGSGLGVSALAFSDGRPVLVQGEGGHVTMAAGDEREAAVLDLMRRRYDHVSAERALSGPGLVNLYAALCELSGEPQEEFTPAQITDREMGERHPRAREATAMFCAMLGTAAGNLALTLGARGGIYIAGGIVPRLGMRFTESAFRTRFEAKGRFRNYLTKVPTYVITRPFPALLGAARLLDEP